MNIAHKLSSATAVLLFAGAVAPAVALGAPSVPPGFTVTAFAAAPSTTPPTTGADDITSLNGDVFIGWQNGVGPKGEPNSKSGQTSSRLVEYSRSGKLIASWELAGKIDGVGGDPSGHRVIASVNEDGNSSIDTITPSAPSGKQVRHYTYSPAPDSGSTGGLLTGGGTDAVTVFRGHIYVTASAPATVASTAVFRVELNPGTGIATLTRTFEDSSMARDAVNGERVRLNLTDPDSSAVVPSPSSRHGGEFVLVSQGDQQLIFARRLTPSSNDFTRLLLRRGNDRAGVDDVRWSEGKRGRLIVVDNKTGTVYSVAGDFKPGTPFGSLDSVGSTANTTEVDTINLKTGQLTPFVTGLSTAKGLLWLAG
ncbi:MAG TPA: hypothetical protein VIX82_07920 [Solirubrobacteraceae bacterium]